MRSVLVYRHYCLFANSNKRNENYNSFTSLAVYCTVLETHISIKKHTRTPTNTQPSHNTHTQTPGRTTEHTRTHMNMHEQTWTDTRTHTNTQEHTLTHPNSGTHNNTNDSNTPLILVHLQQHHHNVVHSSQEKSMESIVVVVQLLVRTDKHGIRPLWSHSFCYNVCISMNHPTCRTNYKERTTLGP